MINSNKRIDEEKTKIGLNISLRAKQLKCSKEKKEEKIYLK